MKTVETSAAYFFQKEQQARAAIAVRNAELWERARRHVDVRIRSYPKGMRRQYQVYVEEMYRDMIQEDLKRKSLIDDQQLYLRLAQAYQIREGFTA